MQPRILIGCPTYEGKAYCLEEFVNGLRKMTYKNKDILLVDNSKTDSYKQKLEQLGINVIKDVQVNSPMQTLVNGRNILRQKVLDEGYDYFFSLEQDVVPPPNVLEKLLEHNKQIITAIYWTIYKFKGIQKVRPLLWRPSQQKDKMIFMNKEARIHGLYKIRMTGLGALLIHRNVLEKIRFRVTSNKAYDDVSFFNDVIEKGFEAYADTSQQCMHFLNIEGKKMAVFLGQDNKIKIALYKL